MCSFSLQKERKGHVENSPSHRWKAAHRGASLRARDTCRPARRSRSDRATPEPRGGGVRPRGDAALPGRDRGGKRGPRRFRLLPGESREDLSRGARALCEGRAGRCDYARRRARGTWRARGRRRPGSDARAGSARAGDRERGALRTHCPRDGDVARAHRRGTADRSARLGTPRRDADSRRPCRAGRLRTFTEPCLNRVQPYRGTAEGELRTHHRPVRGRRRCHRSSLRLPRSRSADLRVPTRQPDHHRRTPEHGEIGARSLRGGEPRTAAPDSGRPLHARDVEVGGDAAAPVQRGKSGVAAAAHRQARPGRLAPPRRRSR